MADISLLFKRSPLFADIPKETLAQQILPHSYFQEYQKDQFLIMPRQKVDRIGIVISGRVHILHLFESGQSSLMGVILSGGLVGIDLACTRSQVSPYHAMAASAAQVFYLPASLLLNPGGLEESVRTCCLQRMLTLISNENMKKEYRLAILSQNGLRERITTYLSMQARRRNQNSFSIPFSREEMAAFLCVNRSALSHELSLMRKEGLISFRKNEFTLHGWELDGAPFASPFSPVHP